MSILLVQQKLRAAGYDPGLEDDLWGEKTERALDLALADARRGRTVSLEAPDARILQPADVEAAAEQLRTGTAEILAVLSVESNGRGFGDDGRPIILFEPHIFSRETKRRFDRTHPDISYVRPGLRPYPKTQGARWGQLGRAIALDRTAALRSASWGLFQIMGFNHAAAGYPTVEAFVEAMHRTEREHLLAFVHLLIDWKLDDELREHRWKAFSDRYNGPAQKGYDARLEAAYARHSRAGGGR